jgi:putative ABC transport system permease protein
MPWSGLTPATSGGRRDIPASQSSTPKTTIFGFTHRQLAAAVAWQATVVAVVGLVVGIPLGIALGRFLWDAFAHQLSVVVDPTVAIVPLALVALGAIVLANLVAAFPGRTAARTPTALVLRAE